jgi:hypothetical protein
MTAKKQVNTTGTRINVAEFRTLTRREDDKPPTRAQYRRIGKVVGTIFRAWSGAKRTPYNGRVYDSKLEALHAAKLDILVRAGKIRSVQPQTTFRLEVAGKLVTTYRADFLITNLDGSQQVHECKGRIARDWAMRKKLFEALNPTIPVTVIQKA